MSNPILVHLWITEYYCNSNMDQIVFLQILCISSSMPTFRPSIFEMYTITYGENTAQLEEWERSNSSFPSLQSDGRSRRKTFCKFLTDRI